MELSIDFRELESVAVDIVSDIEKHGKAGLEKASAVVPGLLRRNFEMFGEVFGDEAWEPISRTSLRKYRKQNRNRFQPLWDTGNLANSGRNLPMEKTDSGSRIDTTLESYGFEHDAGTATTPDGEPVWRRPHMHIYVPDLFEIDEKFESAW